MGCVMVKSRLLGAIGIVVVCGRTVVDRTALTGAFDIDLTFSIDTSPAAVATSPVAASNAPSVFTALQEQLGLKLESTRGPVDVLVIDHVEHPTED